ncbi:thioredoxin domain-containing protein 17 [Thomomys bottae]
MAGPGGSSRSLPSAARGGSSVSLPDTDRGDSSVCLTGAVCGGSSVSLPDVVCRGSSVSLPGAVPEDSADSLQGADCSGSSVSLPGAAPEGSPGAPPDAAPMARYEEVSVTGFEAFNRAVEQYQDKTIFAYFSGSKDAEGKSWCPDCVQAEPVVREGLKHVTEACVFIYCQVGERTYWKDPNNDFRQKLKLTAVPTLLKYGTPQKLVESECLQATLVEMLFSED